MSKFTKISSQMLYVSALRYSANVSMIISPARRTSACSDQWFAPQLECDLAVHAHFGGVVVCRHCLQHIPIGKKSQGVRSGDLGGQSTSCSNLFERPCIYWEQCPAEPSEQNLDFSPAIFFFVQ